MQGHACALVTTFRSFNVQVDFVWVNRDLGSFEWFLEVLEALEDEQRVVGAAMETFLNLHLYKTGAAPLNPSLPLASSIRTGRPDWEKVMKRKYDQVVNDLCVCLVLYLHSNVVYLITYHIFFPFYVCIF